MVNISTLVKVQCFIKQDYFIPQRYVIYFVDILVYIQDHPQVNTCISHYSRLIYEKLIKHKLSANKLCHYTSNSKMQEYIYRQFVKWNLYNYNENYRRYMEVISLYADYKSIVHYLYLKNNKRLTYKQICDSLIKSL